METNIRTAKQIQYWARYLALCLGRWEVPQQGSVKNNAVNWTLGSNFSEIGIKIQPFSYKKITFENVIVRRAGLLLSQQDFEWRWSVPLFQCLTVLEFSFILFDLCLLITFFNFIMNYVPIVTFWIFTYHKIWILSIMFCFIWSYWIINFLACL